MASKKKDAASDPSTTSEAYDHMAPKWDMISALLGGTAAMRAAGKVYLPMHPHETEANYAIRLEGTTLTNMTELTLDSLVGKPFSDLVKLNDDVPSEIADLSDDIDLQGNSLHTFCRSWFREGLAKGFAHVMIDYPVLTEAEKAGRTLADDKRENRRPYWTLIKPENVIFASAEIIHGVEILTHLRLLEVSVERVGYAEVTVNRIRAYYPGRWELLEEKSVRNSKDTEWVVVKSGEIGIPVIPLITFYAARDGLMKAKPPLEDLAFLNARHWRSTSDQVAVLTVARFPMLAVAGAAEGSSGVLTVAPKAMLSTKDPTGKFYYVEHSGKAIKSGAEDLDKLEQDMAAYGAEFLRKKPGAQTATAKALDSAEASSTLQDMTHRFMDAVAQALDITAMWLGKEKGGTVTVLTDFGPEEINDVDLRTLNEARRNRDLSRVNYLKQLVRRGILEDEFDEEENLDQLETEPQIVSPFATGVNVDGSTEGGVDNDVKKPEKNSAQKAPAKKKADEDDEDGDE